ncbi:MAG: hypothetical protein A3G28_07810 [Betaproteobacteria bacterium RIFCSPLOWO2_12_FULL_68_19]|nr:MAG: hypothetical protein A3G28_07810 [Betaproteobacteria bacterium RIFCSPLOWO2_12_FULL_68_19]
MVVLLMCFSASLPVHALSAAAREFMKITAELEPVQCEKRKLRRAIALAEVERRNDDVRSLRQRFASLDRDSKTARLERRLAQLEPRLEKSSDPEDLKAINRQRVEAFYRCE